MYDDDEKRVQFGRIYGASNLAFSLISGLAVLLLNISGDRSVLLAQVGESLCSPAFLCSQFTLCLASIFLSKRASHYRGALALPPVDELFVNWNSAKKAPFARRFGLKLRYYARKLTPIKTIFKYFIALGASWAFLAFIVICFGAPVLSEQLKTAAFVTGLCCQTLWPIILIEGPDFEDVVKVIQGQHSELLRLLLYINCCGGFIGAWLGAVPIPLDWDRPWQVWPLTCVLGTFGGSIVAQIWTVYCISAKRNPSLLLTKKAK